VDKDINHLLSVTVRTVLQAGAQATDFDLRRVVSYKDYREPVTEADLAVERYISEKIRNQFPSHGFDSEEMGQRNTKARYVWILDPIDGTKYYARNIPLYSISLALRRTDELVLGVVYAPELNRMYCASAGGGATLNGQSIRSSDEDALEKASICLEIPSRGSSEAELRHALEKMCVLIKKAYRVRMIGVGSLGLCFCAAGGFDAYVNLGTLWKHYDIAAGQVIVQEAGGEFYYVGKQGRQIIAGPATLCNEIREALKI